MVSRICVHHKKTFHNCPKKFVIQKDFVFGVKYDVYWTIYDAKNTFLGVCSCVMGIETDGFAVENADINIYIGFREVLACRGNRAPWWFRNKIWIVWVAMVISYNKCRWIYLQSAISLSSFLELELCRQCIFFGWS
jgi:hypothetical protein